MSEYSAGEFKIELWESGSPYWACLYYRDKEFAQIVHSDLEDLLHVVKRALGGAQAIKERQEYHDMVQRNYAESARIMRRHEETSNDQ